MSIRERNTAQRLLINEWNYKREESHKRVIKHKPVVSQVVLSSERLVANVARVRPLVRVGALVDQQIVALREPPLTVLADELLLGSGGASAHSRDLAGEELRDTRVVRRNGTVLSSSTQMARELREREGRLQGRTGELRRERVDGSRHGRHGLTGLDGLGFGGRLGETREVELVLLLLGLHWRHSWLLLGKSCWLVFALQIVEEERVSVREEGMGGEWRRQVDDRRHCDVSSERSAVHGLTWL